MSNHYYINNSPGQTSLVDLCDIDGHVLARIMPQGSATHRQIVVDLLRTMVEALEEQWIDISSNTTIERAEVRAVRLMEALKAIHESAQGIIIYAEAAAALAGKPDEK